MASTFISLPADDGGGGGAVTSFNGRTGAVVPLAGDYNAGQITFTPAGNVSATNVQAAIEEVDAEKQATITGAASTIVTANLTANRAVISNAGGKIDVSPTTSAELAFSSGVTSNIQTQLDNKQPLDADLTALAALVTTGMLARTGAGTVATRTVTGSVNISVTNGDGVAGNPTLSITGQIPVANGGTGASTAAAARVNLNIDQRTAVNNANYTILSSDRYVAQTGTMSAPRTWTLPAANSVNAGQLLVLIDESGTVSTTNTITINRAGADTINGATSAVLRTAYGQARLFSDGVSKWTDAVTGVSRGGTGLQTLPTNGQLLIGNSTTQAYTQSTLTAGAGVSIVNTPGVITISQTPGSPALPAGSVGDGVDGDVVISINTTLTRDMFYNNLTVNAGVTLNPGGFTIFVKNTLTVAATGIIARAANNGANASGATAGAAGAALAGTTVGTTGAGGAGATGDLDAGASGATSGAISGEGGVGGVGGNAGQGSGGTFPGGSGGNAGVVTIRYFRNFQENWKYTAVGTYMPTGSGGGGGAAGGGDTVNNGRGGGGGGGAGAPIFILCSTLANSGIIRSKGGNGGNGGAGAVGNVGGGAGGGGGGGGKIMILCNTVTSAGTLDVTGGTRGTGSAGAGTGTAGSDGGDGGSGYATIFEASTGTWTTTS